MPNESDHTPPLLRYLPNYPELCAFTTTRHGGVSKGRYASMNCSPYTGDDPACVTRNQRLLMEALPQCPMGLVIPRQTHGTGYRFIDETFLMATPEERQAMVTDTDALITCVPGICITISTADCIPVLLYDRAHRVVAALHAGWRGTVAMLALRILNLLKEVFGTEPSDVSAVIGPGISYDAFEVGNDVFDAFFQAGFPMQTIARFDLAANKHHIDLHRANKILLTSFGIHESHIEMYDFCTYTRHEDFFSARRLGIRSGRLLTGIMLKRR